MKLVKGFLITGLILVVLGFASWQFFFRHKLEYIEIATAYTAKQVCSCRFVTGRDMDSCKGDFTADITQLEVIESGTQIIATAPLGVASSLAEYHPKLGCALVP
ncbi:hypothetical protein MNBD_ALPHA06-1494 [hydrothermal vent metagenome]|uniref:Uncharacterized protein n=1 Tax=hydrothermal vent metagenome TaxID=652676 RepID=A0A3B0R2E2_9ZZZZ